MDNNIDIPKVARDAFPELSGLVSAKRFALPDTTFDIFITDTQKFFALVVTDYADPYDQSRELKSISGQYEFDSLIRPHGKNSETIDILEHDDMGGNFFVTAPYKNYRLYYYLVNLKLSN